MLQFVRTMLGCFIGGLIFMGFLVISFNYFFPSNGEYYGIGYSDFEVPFITFYTSLWILIMFFPVAGFIFLVNVFFARLRGKPFYTKFPIPVLFFLSPLTSRLLIVPLLISLTVLSSYLFRNFILDHHGCPTYQADFITKGFALGFFSFLMISYFPLSRLHTRSLKSEMLQAQDVEGTKPRVESQAYRGT